MNTLLEFMTFTKGIEYLIAIAFLVAFIAFWQLAYGKTKRLAIRIAVVAYIVAGLLIVLGSCLAAAP